MIIRGGRRLKFQAGSTALIAALVIGTGSSAFAQMGCGGGGGTMGGGAAAGTAAGGTTGTGTAAGGGLDLSGALQAAQAIQQAQQLAAFRRAQYMQFQGARQQQILAAQQARFERFKEMRRAARARQEIRPPRNEDPTETTLVAAADGKSERRFPWLVITPGGS